MRYLEVFLNDNISVIGKNGLVIRQDTQEGIILPVKAFGYKSIKPEPRENFKTEIDTIVLGCQEKGKETYSQLNKIVDLHNAALNQQDLNDAFLNLWSALEVASVTDSSKSKIESVTDNIVSILQNDYFECIFSNILDDLKNNLGNRKVSLLLKDITEFDKEICKIAGFIFLEKYEKYREDYFANELKYYPNIRYKIYNLYEQRENREKLWHLSEKYCQRIEWHLYRLYRLRNAIVHAGESHKRIQMLGEHLHIYVDRVILELMVKLAKDKCLGTIQDVFTDRLKYNRKVLDMNIAAYCRVSTDKADQLNSLEAQKQFFSEYTQRTGDNLVRLYADEGISGTKIKNRKEFLRMMADAEHGLFDMVVVKDISRFARNTVDLLQNVRKLKALGIETQFLTANMTSMGNSEFVLTIFGALAQEESANTSKRVKFGKKMNAEKGRVPNIVYGYDKTIGDYFNLAINEEEAAVIRQIYKWYI